MGNACGLLSSLQEGSTITNVSELTNDAGYQTAANVKSIVTGYGYQTASQVTSKITSYGYQTSSQVTSAIEGYGYQTAANVKSIVTGYGYQTSSQVSSAITSATSGFLKWTNIYTLTTNSSSTKGTVPSTMKCPLLLFSVYFSSTFTYSSSSLYFYGSGSTSTELSISSTVSAGSYVQWLLYSKNGRYDAFYVFYNYNVNCLTPGKSLYMNSSASLPSVKITIYGISAP